MDANPIEPQQPRWVVESVPEPKWVVESIPRQKQALTFGGTGVPLKAIGEIGKLIGQRFVEGGGLPFNPKTVPMLGKGEYWKGFQFPENLKNIAESLHPFNPTRQEAAKAEFMRKFAGSPLAKEYKRRFPGDVKITDQAELVAATTLPDTEPTISTPLPKKEPSAIARVALGAKDLFTYVPEFLKEFRKDPIVTLQQRPVESILMLGMIGKPIARGLANKVKLGELITTDEVSAAFKEAAPKFDATKLNPAEIAETINTKAAKEPTPVVPTEPVVKPTAQKPLVNPTVARPIEPKGEVKGLSMGYQDPSGKPISFAEFLKQKGEFVKRQPWVETQNPAISVAPTIIKAGPRTIAKQGKPNQIPVYEDEISPFRDGKVPDMRLGITETGHRLKKWIENPYRIFEDYPVLDELMFGEKGYNQATDRQVRRNVSVKEQVRGWEKLPDVDWERIGTYATAQQEGGMKILERMKKSVPRLNPSEVRIYNEMRANLEKSFAEQNAALELAGQEPLGYTKDYFTWVRNYIDMDTNFISPLLSDTTTIKKHLTKIYDPFAIERTKRATAPVELNAKKVYQTYMNKANQVIEMSPVIGKARGLVEPFPDGYKLADSHPELAQYIKNWTDRIGGRSNVSHVVRELAKNIATGVLGGNIRTALIQPSSFRLAYVELGERFMADGIALNTFSPAMRKFAVENSNVLRARFTDYNLQTIDRYQPKTMFGKAYKKWGDIKAPVVNASTYPMRLLDFETARSVWLGAYEKGIKGAAKMTPAEAFKYADRVVLETQASALPGHAAPYMNTNVGRMLGVFQTFTTNEWNQIWKNVAHMRESNPVSFGKKATDAARFAAATVGINALFEDVFKLRSPFPAPEQELYRLREQEGERRFGKLAGAAVKELAEQVPIMGGTIRWSTPWKTPMPALPQTILDFVQPLLIQDPALLDNRPFLESVGKMFGIPGTSQTMKFLERIKRGMKWHEALIGVRQEYAPKKSNAPVAPSIR